MGFGKITAKQQEILDYIKDEILKKGYDYEWNCKNKEI